jgi:hypothetical protein
MLLMLQTNLRQPISKLTHFHRISLQVRVYRLYIISQPNFLCRVKTPRIDKRGHGRPHTLNIVQEYFNTQITDSLDLLDSSPNSLATLMGGIE